MMNSSSIQLHPTKNEFDVQQRRSTVRTVWWKCYSPIIEVGKEVDVRMGLYRLFIFDSNLHKNPATEGSAILPQSVKCSPLWPKGKRRIVITKRPQYPERHWSCLINYPRRVRVCKCVCVCREKDESSLSRRKRLFSSSCAAATTATIDTHSNGREVIAAR